MQFLLNSGQRSSFFAYKGFTDAYLRGRQSGLKT